METLMALHVADPALAVAWVAAASQDERRAICAHASRIVRDRLLSMEDKADLIGPHALKYGKLAEAWGTLVLEAAGEVSA